MKYPNIREEELKNKVGTEYFSLFDTTKIIGNVDFCVVSRDSSQELFETESFLWAEAKRGKSDIIKSIVQLILTIGKARTFDKQLPPAYLGAFDGDQIAFLPYNDVQEVFYQNDFNWNVTPSNHTTKEFIQLAQLVAQTIASKSLQFTFGEDDVEINQFIKANMVYGKSSTSKIQIDKNNFLVIYNKWLITVKPTIGVDWDSIKKKGLIDGDFYLADLLSAENQTLKEKLFVLLKSDHYEFDRNLDSDGIFSHRTIKFLDNQKAYNQFWNRYDRPPKQEYWDYIVNRRDLLVPQDVRERKGSFFTPQIWVELSQKYLMDTLGENWQDEYYIWDCAAGTGNLLAGLTNKYNIYASTLDTQDVDVMQDRIKNGANLLEDHVFQFDFLNDEFTDPKVPLSLQKILNDPEKCKKLVIYINPPYAESGSGVGRSFKEKVAIENKTYLKYKDKLGKASNELFAQFLVRVYYEIPDCVIGEFSKLKLLNGSNSDIFRNYFLAKLLSLFVVPGDTFDNVKGLFPIGFKIWNTSTKEKFENIEGDVFRSSGEYQGAKGIYSYNKEKGRINDWFRVYFDKQSSPIGVLHNNKNDFQHNAQVRITTEDINDHTTPITVTNLRQSSIYLAVRQVFEATWLNDRDQFLYPSDGWKSDLEFQSDCLAYTLFHGQNRISSKGGLNHWIPFTETQVNARERFESNFMTDFMAGKLKPEESGDLMSDLEIVQTPQKLEFGIEARAVFDAGLELWRYYHSLPGCNVNASLYDIREHFQGRN
ncbi:MAG: hypothetical protein H7230_03830, partial [Candidatus Parcubacteria bacterium]|nr:hypothetical protein [Candidatus Paceibacterota bacterium]